MGRHDDPQLADTGPYQEPGERGSDEGERSDAGSPARDVTDPPGPGESGEEPLVDVDGDDQGSPDPAEESDPPEDEADEEEALADPPAVDDEVEDTGSSGREGA